MKIDLKELYYIEMTERMRSTAKNRDEKIDLKKLCYIEMADRMRRSISKYRQRILNPKGRKIMYGGPQYKKLIKKGYTFNDDYSQLIEDPDFTGDRNAPLPRGRPKGVKNKLSSAEKGYNPLTNRYIIKSGHLFKELLKKYEYDINKNEFIAHVKDPKQEYWNQIYGDNFSKYIGKGYIYNKRDNNLIRPIQKNEKAFKNP